MEIIIDYKPHSKQEVFHKSNSKFRLICTGVGFGKTAAGVNELIKQAIISKPTIYVAAAPTYKMLKNVTFKEFFKFCPPEMIKSYNKTDAIIELYNGVSIYGMAGDIDRSIDRIRGLNIGGFYGDEIAMCPEYMHEILIARMRDPNGCLKGWYTTTPRGFNWLYRIFVEKKKKDGTFLKDKDAYEIFGGSTLDNPYTPDEYKDSMTDMYSGRFAKQEIEGGFVGFEGLVYPEFDLDNNRCTYEYLRDNIDVKEWIIGVDWGFTNPKAAVLIALDGDKRAYIMDEIYKKRLLIDDFIELIKNWRLKYNFTEMPTIYADPSEVEDIQKFNLADLDCRKANNSVSAGINTVSQHIMMQGDGRTRLYINPECVNTINEFLVYRYEDEKEERPVKDAPLKVNDHAMDAVRYALHTHNQHVIESISIF